MVVHDWPIRGRRQQPVEEYGRAYARDPVAWLLRKRKRINKNRRRGNLARQFAADVRARKRRGPAGRRYQRPPATREGRPFGAAFLRF